MSTLKELLNERGIEVSEDVDLPKASHRGKNAVRDEKLTELKSINNEDFERKKTQLDPTPDLVFLPRNDEEKADQLIGDAGYLVWCSDTQDMWFAPTETCLNMNFIYRQDLDIFKFENKEDAMKYYVDTVGDLMPGIITKKKCYILDNPANESYEVYYDSAYPSMKYGKATPSGMFVYVYDNRFHRDMAIMELDNLYSESSLHNAKKLTQRQMKQNEAIIVSDGAWMKESCSAACYYLDAGSMIKLVKGMLPTEVDQAVLIAEITGATLALSLCRANKKKNITYYYDNTSIVNVFRNRKTEYIEEVAEYKKLLVDMDAEGYKINFVELHPKTGEDKDLENKALCYFHNDCDHACRDMSDIFRKDYKSFATLGNRSGKTFKEVKAEAPKGKGGRPNNNNGKRRY